MKKKNVFLWTATVMIVTVIAILIVVNPLKKDVWDINANKLKKSFTNINGGTYIEDLSKFTPFKWDTLYSFTPYTPKEQIYETIGYEWDNIGESLNEGVNQIVFVKDGKVVCYLYGYPENIGFGFNFGQYEGSHITLTSGQKTSFRTTISGNDVRYFSYIK